jgi:hypothetical protein
MRTIFRMLLFCLVCVCWECRLPGNNNNTKNVHCLTVGRNFNWKEFGKKSNYQGVESLRKTAKNLDQDCRYSDRDSNKAHLKITPRLYRCTDYFAIPIPYVYRNKHRINSKQEYMDVLCNGDNTCFLRGTEWNLKHCVHELRSVQWMLTGISRCRFPTKQIHPMIAATSHTHVNGL